MKIYPVVFLEEPHLDLLYAQQYFFKRSGFKFEPTTIFVQEGFSPSRSKKDFLDSENIRVIVRPPGFWPPPTWAHCMSKLEAYRSLVEGLEGNDYIIDMDADAFLTGSAFLGDLGKADLMGHFWTNLNTTVDRFSGEKWAPISGACMILRVSAIRRMFVLEDEDYIWSKNWLLTHPPFGLVHDHFIPFFMRLAGATQHRPDGSWFAEGKSAEEALVSRDPKNNVAHLYGAWTSFGGISVSNKCDVPSAMKKLGIIE